MQYRQLVSFKSLLEIKSDGDVQDVCNFQSRKFHPPLLICVARSVDHSLPEINKELSYFFREFNTDCIGRV